MMWYKNEYKELPTSAGSPRPITCVGAEGVHVAQHCLSALRLPPIQAWRWVAIKMPHGHYTRYSKIWVTLKIVVQQLASGGNQRPKYAASIQN